MCYGPDVVEDVTPKKADKRKRAEINVENSEVHDDSTFVAVEHPNAEEDDSYAFHIPDRDIPRLIKALNRRLEKKAKKAAKKASKGK